MMSRRHYHRLPFSRRRSASALVAIVSLSTMATITTLGGYQPDDEPAAENESLEVVIDPKADAPPGERPISVEVVRDPVTGEYMVDFAGESFESTEWREIELAVRRRSGADRISFVTAEGDQFYVSPRSMIGLLVEPVEGALASQLELTPGGALQVVEVYPDLPAERAGLKQYDIIVELNGDRTVTRDDLSLALSDAAPGARLNLVALRSGAPLELEVELAPYDPGALRLVEPAAGALSPLNVSLLESIRASAEGAAASLRLEAPMLIQSAAFDELIPTRSVVRSELQRFRIDQVATESEIEDIKARLDRIEQLLQLLVELQADGAGAGSPASDR